MAVVYIHRKETNNEIFYVGIGSTKKRAYESHKSLRSTWWTKTVNKHGRTVEILEDDISVEEAIESEISLIELIGRKDMGLGSLVNMTDGGEGGFNVITKKVVHIESGVVYNNLRTACTELGFNYKAEWRRVNDYSTKRNFKKLGDNTPVKKHGANKTSFKGRPVIHLESGEEFINLKEACKVYGLIYYKEQQRANRMSPLATFVYKEKSNEPRKESLCKIKVRHIESGVVYPSIAEACRELNLSMSSERRRLLGEVKKKPSFELVNKKIKKN